MFDRCSLFDTDLDTALDFVMHLLSTDSHTSVSPVHYISWTHSDHSCLERKLIDLKKIIISMNRSRFKQAHSNIMKCKKCFPINTKALK